MKTFAILIDAGFAKSKLGTVDHPATAEIFKNLVSKICEHALLQEKYLYRVYFYDAPPFSKTKNRPLNGGPRNFAADPLTIANRKLHQQLKTIDYFALRMGEVRFRGWELDQRKLPNERGTCMTSLLVLWMPWKT